MSPQARKLAWVPPLACVLASVVANAGNVSSTIFRIDATNTVGSGYLEFTSDMLTYQPATNQWVWTTSVADIVTPDNDIIATLDSATLKLVKDPVSSKPYYLELGFALQAGVSDTDFALTAARISFPTLPSSLLQPPNGGGRAVASLTVTDTDGNGVTLTPAGPTGSGAYQAQYNGLAPSGITFASLIGEMTVGPGGSGNASQTYPGSGYAPINDDVYDMGAMLAFHLTHQDSASGTTTYRLLPEPAAGVGALMLLLAASWRRR